MTIAKKTNREQTGHIIALANLRRRVISDVPVSGPVREVGSCAAHVACLLAALTFANGVEARHAHGAEGEPSGPASIVFPKKPSWLGGRMPWKPLPMTPPLNRFCEPMDSGYRTPPFWGLGADTEFCNGLRLSKDQEQRLRTISASVWQETIRKTQQINNEVNRLSGTPQFNAAIDASCREIDSLLERDAKSSFDQMSKVLTPAQVLACEKRGMADTFAAFLEDPNGLKLLGASKDQVDRFGQLDLEWRNRRHPIYQVAGAKCLAVFSPGAKTQLLVILERQDHERSAKLTARTGTAVYIGEPEPWKALQVLPVYEQLELPIVRNDLKFTPDQANSVRTVSAKCASNSAGQGSTDAIRTQLEAILTTSQLAQLKEMIFRERIVELTFTPAVSRAVDLTPNQKNLLKALDRELADEMFVLNWQTSERAIAILSDAQRSKVRDELYRGGHIVRYNTVVSIRN